MKLQPTKERTAEQTAAILGALPGTYEQLGMRTGLPRHTVLYRVRIMRQAQLCRIGGWARVTGKGGKFMPVIHAGQGKDAQCKLVAMTDREYGERFRTRIKNTIEGELRRAKGRARAWRIKAEKQGSRLSLPMDFFKSTLAAPTNNAGEA